MRAEKEMLSLILGVAEADERIRAVYMNGSRADPAVKRDRYQDYDIVYAVTAVEPFAGDRGLPAMFGEPAIVQEPDANDAALGATDASPSRHTWLMLFKDGVRIDLTVMTAEAAAENALADRPTVALLDKDGLLPPIPAGGRRLTAPPDARAFAACCNEFWWRLNNVAKGAARDQLPYTRAMFDGYVRAMLNRMTEWSIGVATGFSVSAGKLGKYYKEYMPTVRYALYESTYAGPGHGELWAAVGAASELFRLEAREVAAHFGYIYNEAEDANMTAYLAAVRREMRDG